MDCKIVINDCTQDLITACIVVSRITMFINFPFHRKSFVHIQGNDKFLFIGNFLVSKSNGFALFLQLTTHFIHYNDV